MPNRSRSDQRMMEATQSFASTGSPSWNISPSRRANFQCSPSAETS
jgi:hypothetical protein